MSTRRAQRKSATYLLLVRLFVEIGEQEEKQNRMRSDEVREVDGIVAFVPDQQLECVQHDQHELHHLQQGQVFLPPQVLLDFGSHRGEHVVSVHDDVHERVEEAEERAVAAGREFDAPPHRRGHDAVVDDVQRRHLVVPLSHHEEDGVEELGELGEEVPPASGRHLWGEERMLASAVRSWQRRALTLSPLGERL